MLSDAVFCRTLRKSLGADCHFVVAKLANWEAIRRGTSIPTASLAAKRFEVGVLASFTDWIEAGMLSPSVIGMVVPAGLDDGQQLIQASLERFSFIDPWSRTRQVSLQVAVVSVDLGGFASLDDLFQKVSERLDLACSRFPDEWRSLNRAETWCTEA